MRNFPLAMMNHIKWFFIADVEDDGTETLSIEDHNKRMKTALITGGAGFIAHHLIARILTQTDWNIVTLDRLDYSGNLNRLE